MYATGHKNTLYTWENILNKYKIWSEAKKTHQPENLYLDYHPIFHENGLAGNQSIVEVNLHIIEHGSWVETESYIHMSGQLQN